PTGFNPGFYEAPTTWDPTWSLPGVTYTNGNLNIATTASNTTNVRTKVGRKSGRYYWEITATGGDGVQNGGGLGILESAMPNNAPFIGNVASGLSFGYACCATNYFMNWSGAALGVGTPLSNSAVKAGTVYMFALDAGAGRFWTGQDGIWYGAGN